MAMVSIIDRAEQARDTKLETDALQLREANQFSDLVSIAITCCCPIMVVRIVDSTSRKLDKRAGGELRP